MPEPWRTRGGRNANGREFDEQELAARAFVLDVAIAAQTLACELALHRYYYAERCAREASIGALEWLDLLDQLVGHPLTEVP